MLVQMLQKAQQYYNSGCCCSDYTRWPWPLTNESSQWQQHQWPYKSHNVRSSRNQSHFCVVDFLLEIIESHESYQSFLSNSTLLVTVFENHKKMSHLNFRAKSDKNWDFLGDFQTPAHCLKITQNVALEFCNFGIFHQFLSY